MGVKSDCSTEGYVLASWNNSGMLESDGTLHDNVAAGGMRVPLFLDLVTDVPWERTYDVGRGTSGVFNEECGCFGETYASLPPGTANLGCYGRLWIMFEKKKVPTVRFQWNFDCYEAHPSKRVTIREHFYMTSDPVLGFPAWTGGNISGPVNGTFELKRYLNGTTETFGSRPFDFDLVIEKLPLP
jgi:hypothetical protein